MPARTPSPFLPDAVHAYLEAMVGAEPEALVRLRTETARLPQAHYQISPAHGRLLRFMLEVTGARRVLDIGTFTGCSALVAALSVPADGEIHSFELTDRFAAMARRHWQDAGVASRIRLHIGPASESLQALIDDGEAGRFDFAVIDADKESYDRYYELVLTLLRPDGVALLDNTLWRGRVVNAVDGNPRAAALRTLNRKVRDDSRVSHVLLPLGDGVTLVRKRP